MKLTKEQRDVLESYAESILNDMTDRILADGILEDLAIDIGIEPTGPRALEKVQLLLFKEMKRLFPN